jgi:hypothetical protein
LKTSPFRTFGFWSAILLATSAVTFGCASGDGEDPAPEGDGDGDGDGDAAGGAVGDGDGDGAGGSPPMPVSVCDGATSAPTAALVSDLETDATGWDIYASTPDADG